MKVVVDTNVIVSGLISPGGPPGTIINMVAGGDLKICYDSRILAEYGVVLGRPEFNIAASTVAELLGQIVTSGETIPTLPLHSALPDRSDEVFLEVALAAPAYCLITGNLKHFPASSRQGMRVFSPAEFLGFYRSQQDRAGGSVKSPATEYRIHDVGDTAWTSEEVAQVIQGIRRSAPSRQTKYSARNTIKNLTRKPRSKTPSAKARLRRSALSFC